MKSQRQLLLLLFLLFAILNPASAQLKKGYKLLKKGNYELAIQAFELDVFNAKGDVGVEAEYNLAKIYFTKTYEGYDLEKAYQYAKSALKRHEKLKTDETTRIQKKGLGKLTIDNYKRQILNAAYDAARAEDNYKAYEYFLRNFDGPTLVQGEKIMIWRNQRGLDEAAKINTWNALESFYKKHGESCHKISPEVDTQAQMLMFEAYMRERNWTDFYNISFAYPNNVYVRDSAAAAQYIPIALSNNINDYKKFLIGFPKSPFAKLAIDNIYRLTMESKDYELYDYFVRNFASHPKIESLWAQYYKLYTSENKNNASEEFLKNYPNAILKKAQTNNDK